MTHIVKAYVRNITTGECTVVETESIGGWTAMGSVIGAYCKKFGIQMTEMPNLDIIWFSAIRRS